MKMIIIFCAYNNNDNIGLHDDWRFWVTGIFSSTNNDNGTALFWVFRPFKMNWVDPRPILSFLKSTIERSVKVHYVFNCLLSGNPCNKPSIANGYVEPNTAEVLHSLQYSAYCDSWIYTLVGSASIACWAGSLSSLPSCLGTKVTLN